MTLPFTFAVPPRFTPLDLPAAPPDAPHRTARRIADVWPAATAARCAALVGEPALVARRLGEGGVRYAATVVDPAGPTTGLFTIALHPTREHDPLSALAAAVPRSAAVRAVEIALGHALVIAEDPAVADRLVRQLLVAVHLPAEEAVAVFGMGTEHLDDWETYARHLARVVRGTSARGTRP